MAPLAELIAASNSRGATATVEEAVFGTGDPETLARILTEFCEVELSSSPVDALFHEVSVFSSSRAEPERARGHARRW